MNSYQTFRQLHHQKQPFVLGNVWDAASARLCEELGFQAIGTSSAAIAKSLGYEDGEKITFEDLLFVVKKIKGSTSIPLSVDIEGGYGQSTKDIAQNIISLYELGVVGVNLEDSKVNDCREIMPSREFQKLLAEIKKELANNGVELFLNVRTDTFLLQLPGGLNETLERIKLYRDAGADGIFVPSITNPDDIKKVANEAKIPINVMAMPNLPSFEVLSQLGVKRISTGNFAHNAMLLHLKSCLEKIQKEKSFKTLFSND